MENSESNSSSQEINNEAVVVDVITKVNGNLKKLLNQSRKFKNDNKSVCFFVL